jgi:hypothetical protein
MTHITTSRDLSYTLCVTARVGRPCVSTVTTSRDAGHGGLLRNCVEIFRVGPREARLDKAGTNSETGGHARAY